MRLALNFIITTVATLSLSQIANASEIKSLYCQSENVSATLFVKLTEAESKISGSYSLATSKDSNDLIESYSSAADKNNVYIVDNNNDYSLLLKKSNEKWVALLNLKDSNINFTLLCE